MEKEVIIGEDSIILDTDTLYSGKGNPEEKERKVRKAIGLPVTKHLVYYGDRRDPESKVKVSYYRIVEMYDITSPWYTLEITTDTQETVLIHSAYFKEMQDPNFIKAMEAQEAAAGRITPYEERETSRMRWDAIHAVV